MKTLLVSRLALFGMVFAVIAITSFSKPDLSSNFIATTTITAKAAPDKQSVFASADEPTADKSFISNRSANFTAQTVKSDKTAADSRKRYWLEPENNLIYRQSVFDEFFPGQRQNETYLMSATDSTYRMNKSSPLRQ